MLKFGIVGVAGVAAMTLVHWPDQDIALSNVASVSAPAGSSLESSYWALHNAAHLDGLPMQAIDNPRE